MADEEKPVPIIMTSSDPVLLNLLAASEQAQEVLKKDLEQIHKRADEIRDSFWTASEARMKELGVMPAVYKEKKHGLKVENGVIFMVPRGSGVPQGLLEALRNALT